MSKQLFRAITLQLAALLSSALLSAASLAVPLCAASAQDRESLRRRIDSLELAHEGATRAVKARAVRDSLARAQSEATVEMVEVSDGILRLSSDARFATTARLAVGDAAELIRATFGSFDGVVVQARLVQMPDAGAANGGSSDFPVMTWQTSGEQPVVRGPANLRSPDLRREIRHHLCSAASEALTVSDSAMRNWSGTQLVACNPLNETLAAVFRGLSLSPRPAGRLCLDGDVHACRDLLALAEPALMVDNAYATARLSLIRHALVTGGAEAFSRFKANSGSGMVARVEAASGIPVDSLVSSWRHAVIEARPAPAHAGIPTTFNALCWGALLCLLAMRSSRWR